MQLSCFHCSQEFAITADQLGGKATCPHCGGEVNLPKADDDGQADERSSKRRWLGNSLSTLASVVFHMLLVIVAAFITFGGAGGEGSGEDVLLGELPSEVLGTSQSEEFDAEEAVDKQSEDSEDAEELEVAPPIASESSDEMSEELMITSPSTGGDAGAFSVGEFSAGGSGSMAGGSWDGLIQNLRRNGLDIVLAFDSTGSMGGEIREVKAQISRIGGSLVRLVPKARISICTYRDDGDAYVVKGIPLTNNIQDIEEYLRLIDAGGGGDHPEAVHEGLAWSVNSNRFRPRARKIILLFGDAPPHEQLLSQCLRTASDFQQQNKGVVSTVTCRQSRRIPEFIDIAQMGGGEAFLTVDERQIMTKLMILVFGSRYKDKVVEAFRLLEK